jgi:hypothetical protein
MSSFQSGTIQAITLKDDNPNEVYSIQVLTAKGGGNFETAFPLDTNIKRIPLLGESVILISALGPEGQGGSRRQIQYYLNPTSVQVNVHNNALPKGAVAKITGGTASGIPSAAAGNPAVTKKSSDSDLGAGFVERTDVGSLHLKVLILQKSQTGVHQIQMTQSLYYQMVEKNLVSLINL